MKMKMNLEKHYKKFFIASLSVMLIGLIVFLTMGFKLGIDFKGGTGIDVKFTEPVKVSDIETALKPFELEADIVNVGSDGKEVIIKTAKELDLEARTKIFDTLSKTFSTVGDNEYIIEQYSPTVGREILNRALYSVLVASIGMLIYITVRFEWKFGIAAVVALVHDVLILLTVYLVFRIPVNEPFIVAVLTVVGYSINDTIVVFDRIRDTLKYAKTSNYYSIADDSINQTLRRSINTSVTTLLVIGALYILAVPSIKELALPLLAGVAIGTYSSIFIASPIWILFKYKFKSK